MQALSGTLNFEMSKITCYPMICLALWWIRMKNVETHHVFTFSTSKGDYFPYSSIFWYLTCFVFRFDNSGAGACLRRYSDPSYFKKSWDVMRADKTANLQKERSQKFKVLLVIFCLAILVKTQAQLMKTNLPVVLLLLSTLWANMSTRPLLCSNLK